MPGTVAVAKTLLQFIGLVVLTSKVSNDPGLHAILPRISANAHVPTLTNPNAPIDEHAAVLVFKKSDYVPGSVKNWPLLTFPAKNSDGSKNETYAYILLTGQTITFTSRGRVLSQAVIPKLPLPRIKNCCSTATDLNARFRKPYPGAAAVVTVPSGEVEPCHAKAPNVSDRIDTRVLLDSKGDVTALAVDIGNKRPTHTITFKAGARIYVANLPVSFLRPAMQH